MASSNIDQDMADLDLDNPYSDAWPEAFSNGREEFSEQFYQRFPWARGVDPFDDTVETIEDEDPFEYRKGYRGGPLEMAQPSRSEFPLSKHGGLPLDHEAEAPPVAAYVNSLISLELDDLPDDEQHCPICRDQYRCAPNEEMPLELTCPGKHVVGKDCLLDWLSSISGVSDDITHNTCPICRAELVTEVRQPLDTRDGLEQLLRDANHLLTAQGPLTLNRKWRRRWEGVKQYVNAYIEEAGKKVRYRLFIDMLQKEISGDSIYSYAPFIPGRIETARFDIWRVFDEAQRRGSIWTWLEEAESSGLGLDVHFNFGTDNIDRFLECVMHNVYKREIINGEP